MQNAGISVVWLSTVIPPSKERSAAPRQPYCAARRIFVTELGSPEPTRMLVPSKTNATG